VERAVDVNVVELAEQLHGNAPGVERDGRSNDVASLTQRYDRE
jgi:hypothetical protein